MRSDLPLRKVRGGGPPGGWPDKARAQDPAAPPPPATFPLPPHCSRAQAGRRAGRGYLAAKRPAANEPGEERSIFSSRSSGRLITAAGSRQAAMETLNATAGSSVPGPGPQNPSPSPGSGRQRCHRRGGAPRVLLHRRCVTRGRLCPFLGVRG